MREERKQRLHRIVVIDNRDTKNRIGRRVYNILKGDLRVRMQGEIYPWLVPLARAWTATLAAGFSYRYSCSTSWYRSLFIAPLFLSPFVPGTRRSSLSVSFPLSSSLSVGRWFLFLRVLIRVGGRSPPPHSLSAGSLPLPSMLRRNFGSRFLCSHGPSREQRRSANVKITLYTS